MRKTNKMLNERAFDACFRQYYGELYVFARQFVDNKADCEDIVSDAFETVWHNRSGIETATLRAYLYKNVRNRCIDLLRRQNVRRNYTELMAAVTHDYTSADGLAEMLERERIVEDVLSTLPDYTHRIFTACYVEHKPYAQVAEEMCISSNTVKKYVSRALQLIAEQRQKYKKY